MGASKFDGSFNILAFTTFPNVRGGITHEPFLVNKYAHLLSITVNLCVMPEFRKGGNLQRHNIDIGEFGSAATCKRDWLLPPCL